MAVRAHPKELKVGIYLTDGQDLLMLVGDSGANGKLAEDVKTGEVKGYADGELLEMDEVTPGGG